MKLHLPKALFTAVLAAFALGQSYAMSVADNATAKADDLIWSYSGGDIVNNMPDGATVSNSFTLNTESGWSTTPGNSQVEIKDINSSSTDGFTVSFTLVGSATPNWTNIFSVYTKDGAEEAYFQKAANGNLMVYTAGGYGGGTHVENNPELNLGALTSWYGTLMTVTFADTSTTNTETGATVYGSTLSVYKDGVLAGTYTYKYENDATPSVGVSDVVFNAGLDPNDRRRGTYVTIGSAAIWDSAMTAEEVAALAAANEVTLSLTGTTNVADTAWPQSENTVKLVVEGENAALVFSGDKYALGVKIEGGDLTMQGDHTLYTAGKVTIADDTTLTLDDMTISTGSSGLSYLTKLKGDGRVVLEQGGAFKEGSRAANTLNTEFGGTVEVAANKTLALGDNEDDKFDWSDATIQLNANSRLEINANNSQLGTLYVAGNNSTMHFEDGKVGEALLNIGEVNIDAGTKLTMTSHWEGTVTIANLNAEGALDLQTSHDESKALNVVIEAIERSGLITSINQLTLGKADANSVLNIGGTITNSGTLTLADADVVLNVNVGITGFVGTTELDADSVIWDVAANKVSETGNGFMSVSGYMQVISNTGTIKIGDTTVEDLSTLKVTYKGTETTLEADGRIHVSGCVTSHYVVGGTGDAATVAMSSILADAAAAGVSPETVTLGNGTTLTVDAAHTLDTLNVTGTSATVGGTQKLTVGTLSAATSTVYANTSMDLGDKAHSVSKLEIGNGATVTSTRSGSGTGNGFVTGAVTVNGGGTLALSGLDALGYSNGGGDQVDSVTLAGAEGKLATLKLGARSTLMGTTMTLQGHTRILCTNDDAKGATESNADKASLDMFTSDGVTFNISGTNNESEVGLRLRKNLTLALADGATFAQKGAIYNSGKLIVSGKGKVDLHAANQYSGGTDISKATVVARAAGALGTGAVSISDGGSLDLEQYTGNHGITAINLSGGSTLTVRNGDYGNALNTAISVDGDNTLLSGWGGNNGKVQGTINGKGTLQLQQLIYQDAPTSDTWKLESTISDKSDTEKLAITSDANVTLNGTNTYSGGTEITGKTLTTASEKALGEGTVTVKGGTLKQDAALSVTALDYQSGTVNNNGNNLTVGELTVGSTQLAMTGAGTTTVTGTLTVGNTEAFTMEGALVLTGATIDLSGFTVDTTLANMPTSFTLGTAKGGITRDEKISFTGLTVEGYNIDITTMPVTSESGIAMAAEGDTTALVLTLTANQPAEQPLDKLTITGGTFDATSGVLTFTTEEAVTDNLASTIEVTMSDEVWNGILEKYTTLPDTVLVSFQGKDSEQLFDFNGDGTAQVPTITINGEGVTGDLVVRGDGTIVGNYVTAYIPEPTTTTLSLLALAGLAVRRRRASR